MKTHVPVATFNDLEHAEKLQKRLIEAGVPALIHDQTKLERYGFMTPPLASYHVEVPDENYLASCQLIKQWDRVDGVLRMAVCCPECGSSRVEFPQLTRKFALPGLARLFMALGFMEPEFYCVDCHCTWPTKVPVEPKLDILGFPVESRWARFRRERRQRKLARLARTAQAH